MEDARRQIFKFQWLVLSLASICSILTFYYGEGFPDHFGKISSGQREISYFSYYFFGPIYQFHELSGPWITIPFILCSILNFLFFQFRKYLIDILFIPSLCFIFAIGTYFLVPSILGESLQFLMEVSLKNHQVFFWCSGFMAIISISIVLFYDFIHLFLLQSFYKAKSSFRIGKISNVGEKKNLLEANLNKMILSSEQEKKKSSFFPLLKDKSTSVHHKQYLEKGKIKDEDREGEATLENCDSRLEDDKEELSQNEISASKKKEDSSEFLASEEDNTEKDELDFLPLPIKYPNALEFLDSFQSVEGEEKTEEENELFNQEKEGFLDVKSCLESKLEEFKIQAIITNVLVGPVVNTFELELGPGVKVSKITSISEDLSLALCGIPIRLVYPLKGRSTVGIEVPKKKREIIQLTKLLKREEYQSSKDLHLPLSLGKDVFGDVMYSDLISMPHMLVAGATGSGKSVFINSLILSLIIAKNPYQLKLILIDPKQLELAFYAEIPHLHLPVLTTPGKSLGALVWACQEMERRYSLLKDYGVRNVEGFNEKLKEMPLKERYLAVKDFTSDPEFKMLPYLVIVIDEFADLILSKRGKDIEYNVCRLAAKARAAGIHIILATQRPSIDVITGLIKSNFPTRVSFKVTSSIDSRTILNTMGAEKLLGMGDMLYKHGIDLVRIHSAYISEDEIEKLTAKLAQFGTQFSEEAVHFIHSECFREQESYFSLPNPDNVQDGSELSEDVIIDKNYFDDDGNFIQQNEEDQLFQVAMKIVIDQGQASASMIQRRLKIGYNRAANILDMMEEKGFVGPGQGPRPRDILVGPDEYLSFSSKDECIEEEESNDNKI